MSKMKHSFPAPAGLSVPAAQEPRKLFSEADIFISPKGDDGAEGSLGAPVKTFEAARAILRGLRAEGRTGTLKIAVMAGEYRINGFKLTDEDSDSQWRVYGDGEVIINGGAALFDGEELNSDEISRLHGDAVHAVRKYDLKKAGLTCDDWDRIYPIGAYANSKQYDSHKEGVSCEVFCDGNRMTLARYPNTDEYLRLDGVFDQGQPFEYPPQNYFHEYGELRNPEPGIYAVSDKVNERIKTWRSHEDIWIFGWFYHDWADSSTPVKKFDTNRRKVYPEYVSKYGARAGAPFFFYNVFEELDAPGEYYIDRENGILYVYPTSENPTVEISVAKEPLLCIENACNVTIDGFVLKCTRSDAIVINGDGCVVENCDIHGVYGNAAKINGTGNTFRLCEISHTGRGGVIVNGGSRDELVPGNNLIENCLFHNWGEVYMTYNPAVGLNGVGNRCAHCEMFDAPHMAIGYGGNDNIVEYNIIRNVVRRSSDAGAIYSGGDWFAYGNIVRYNCFFDVTGDGDQYPFCLYWDDTLSGQTAYGNYIINTGNAGAHIGGGRNNKLFGNVIVNAGEAILYDDRGRDGILNHGWAHASYETPGGGYWRQFGKFRFREGIWAEKYPELKEIHDDFNRIDDPGFQVNPTGAFVSGNIVIQPEKDSVGWIADSVYKYGTVENNPLFKSAEDAGLDGDYMPLPGSAAQKALPDFVKIPVSEIGRKFVRR
ncbi:MAG: right-handed parallel beta-helix repeat-containing protein [Firmicutes bacterium]|nr:right-handed parallel beta-helix repeat-containing protein [Bacillota bacterium]